MSRQSTLQAKQLESRRLFVMLVAGAVSLVCAVMGVVVYVLAASGDAQEQRDWEVAAEPAVKKRIEAPVLEPIPAPLGEDEPGYGRPEPLFAGGDNPSNGTSGAAPLFIDPANPPAPGGGSEPVQVQGVGARPDVGSLPGRYGNPYARVQLVVFNDFECPFCSKLEPTFEQLHQRYGGDLELYFRDYPLAMHSHARGAHMAARCAHDQGRFWDMYDTLFANQRALTPDDLSRYATQLGLDRVRFEGCLSQEHHAAAIEQDTADAKAAGVTGTPATFVNGVMVRGAKPFDAFVEIIEAAR